MRAVAVIFLLVAIVTCDDPKKPMWPSQFDVEFGLNMIPTPNNAAMINISSHFYYDWDQFKASTIDYYNYCLPGLYQGSENGPCKIIFVPQGTFFINSTMNETCEWIPGVGSIPPDFLTPFNFTGYTNLVPDFNGVLHVSNFWNGGGGFQYWTDAETGDDVQLCDGGAINWNFGPFNVVPQSKEMFDIGVNPPPCSFSLEATKHIPLFRHLAAYYGVQL
eukprot:TRINITY_DN3117_c0_g2_i1.p1 TRINITY_DN3117_c0_g2~~TRINITY_DN3117_c0_g2_i1.p1  ORF type:complete len:232 (+),score=60.46 TRINITY_DN3117_c0_g2_i1:41-697(+)